MKYLITVLLILGVTSGKAVLWGDGTEMGLHICMHNGVLYATTTQVSTCPSPPTFVPTPEEELLGKTEHNHGGSVSIFTNKTVQHDPDCIINKIPYTN